MGENSYGNFSHRNLEFEKKNFTKMRIILINK